MSEPYNYENSMRIHDAAVYSWLDDLLVDYGDIAGQPRNQMPILRVFAAPHRAFAQAYDLLVKMGWAAGGNDEAARLTAEADWSTLPLPFCTIDRDYPVMAQELAASVLSYDTTFRDPITGDWVILPYPLHALTTYRLTFWCLKRYTEAHILEWFYTRFGQRGAGNREVYLPVHHQPPFGVQRHAFKWIGTGDQSDLEGENPRYIRMNATCMLRTWFMRGAWPSARREPAVHAVQRQAYDPNELLSTCSWWGSGNLWSIRNTTDPASLSTWPVDGQATVASDGNRGLVATLSGDWDGVQLIELPPIKLEDDYQILSVSGTVATDGPVNLYVDDLFGDPTPVVLPTLPQVYPVQQPIPVNSSFTAIYPAVELVGELKVGTRVWDQPVPAGDASFHEFVLSRGNRFVYGVDGGPAEATVSRIDVRQIFDADRIVPTRVDGGTEWIYSWAGLPLKPHLVVVRLTNPTTPGVTLSFEDDATTPGFSRNRDVHTPHTLGLAALLQPKVDSLRVRIPKTVVVEDAYARPFDGPFLGGTLLP